MSNASNAGKPSRFKLLPVIFLIVGVGLGVISGVLSLMPATGAAPIVFGAGAAIAAIVLTFAIAIQQNDDNAKLHRVLATIEERTAVREYEPDTPSLPEESPVAAGNGGQEPTYANDAIAEMRKKGAHLNFDNLRWRQKIPSQPMTGNHGWFVDSGVDGEGERWFVRRANGLTVRKAMPRKFLEALESEANLDPRDIKLDFQLSNHGLSAWYARTYSGDLWKVSRSNRNASAGIKVNLEMAEQ